MGVGAKDAPTQSCDTSAECQCPLGFDQLDTSVESLGYDQLDMELMFLTG